jgi:hypothetical protein
MIVTHGVAEQIVERAAPFGTEAVMTLVPAFRAAMRLALAPEIVEPARIVVIDRGVVEHLRGERIGAAGNEQVRQLLDQRMLAAALLAMADHAVEQRERIVPIVDEPCGGVGAMIEQQGSNLDRMRFRAGETAVGEIQDRLPVERAALLFRRSRFVRQMPLHLVEIAAKRSEMERVARETGHARGNAHEDARGTRLVAVPGLGGLEQQIGKLGMAAEREREIVEHFPEGCPAGQAELTGKRELDMAQAWLCGAIRQDRE